MKTTPRFERAITKLYTAFHEGTLNAMDCTMCAVGNICNNKSGWAYATDNSSTDNLTKNVGYINEADKFLENEGIQYSVMELANIEKIFLSGIGYTFPRGSRNNWSEIIQTKELQFKGLCAVVEYLCELDGIPNVMDYSSLFDYDEQGAKKELKEVF